MVVPDTMPLTLPHAEHLFSPNFLEPQLLPIMGTLADFGFFGFAGTPLYIDIAPPVGIEYLKAPYLMQRGATSIITPIALTNYTNGAHTAKVIVTAPPGIFIRQSASTVDFSEEDEESIVTIAVILDDELPSGDYPITTTIHETGYSVQAILRVVDYSIPEGINVGVIQSYDTTFLNTLTRMGVPHEALEKDDFTASKLDEFSTIIVDIRAYLVRPDLIANNQAMLEYVKRGGTMIVMYQKTFEWKKEYAPYPLSLSHNRVTREDALITLLHPKHPLFTTPNRMGDIDWAGWRQERGLYFPSKWDEAYTPLIEVHDPGETPPPGSLLIADYGEGVYVYTALGWYRQLRELHPGTVKMFANMLAL